MDQDQPNFNGVCLDRTTVPQEQLDIDAKQRSNLFPWNGQFSPQLIEVLLRTYAPKQGLVLDPFAGSGTVMHEAGRLGLSAFGAEINPAACAMARIYGLINRSTGERTAPANRLDGALRERLPVRGPSLFSTDGPATDEEIKTGLVEIRRGAGDEVTRVMLEALIVLVDFYRDVTDEKVYGTWAKLKATILALPESGAPIRLVDGDARRLPLAAGAADIVITSPPYINVFNYHQQYRRSAEALGWDLLAVARSEIGSNRKHRQNRFLTVIQYCVDMADALRELRRVCKSGARVIAIVGRESNVRKTRFFNGEIVAALASRCAGLTLASRQERVFMNRFGTHIIEDLLHFDVARTGAARPERPQTLAREVLTAARRRAPRESLGDLEEALGRVDDVRGSPVYDPTVAGSPSSDRGGMGVTTRAHSRRHTWRS